jgi:Uma2 family endonuclease
VTLLNPRVIIEVLSETTEEYDRGAKVAHYRHRTSVDLILLIDSQRRMVERQQRNPDGTWTLSEHTRGAVIVLDHEVPLDELYEGVTLMAARS